MPTQSLPKIPGPGVILEGHQQAHHGGVIEHCEKSQDHDQQYVDQLVPADVQRQVVGHCLPGPR